MMIPEYISREAAIQAVMSAMPGGVIPTYESVRSVDTIGALPAADVAPVRHGRWNPTSRVIDDFRGRWGHFQLCTACDTLQKKPSAYCPACGARMDAKEATNAD